MVICPKLHPYLESTIYYNYISFIQGVDITALTTAMRPDLDREERNSGRAKSIRMNYAVLVTHGGLEVMHATTSTTANNSSC